MQRSISTGLPLVLQTDRSFYRDPCDKSFISLVKRVSPNKQLNINTRKFLHGRIYCCSSLGFAVAVVAKIFPVGVRFLLSSPCLVHQFFLFGHLVSSLPCTRGHILSDPRRLQQAMFQQTIHKLAKLKDSLRRQDLWRLLGPN